MFARIGKFYVFFFYLRTHTFLSFPKWPPLNVETTWYFVGGCFWFFFSKLYDIRIFLFGSIISHGLSDVNNDSTRVRISRRFLMMSESIKTFGKTLKKNHLKKLKINGLKIRKLLYGITITFTYDLSQVIINVEKRKINNLHNIISFRYKIFFRQSQTVCLDLRYFYASTTTFLYVNENILNCVDTLLLFQRRK